MQKKFEQLVLESAPKRNFSCQLMDVAYMYLARPSIRVAKTFYSQRGQLCSYKVVCTELKEAILH